MSERENIINIQEAMERVLGHNDMYLRWLDDFFVDETMQKVSSAYESGDYDMAHSAVHKLKGTAANLAVLTLAETARMLDDKIKERATFDSMREIYEKLFADYKEANDYFREKRLYISEYSL